MIEDERGFLFFYFYIFVFYKNIFSISNFRFLQKYIFDLEIYRNTPRCRAARSWPPGNGAAGAFLKKNFAEKIARRSLGAGRPAAGRPALAARLQGDRLSHPYIRVGWSPTPHLHHYNSRNQEKREPATACNQNSSTLYK